MILFNSLAHGVATGYGGAANEIVLELLSRGVNVRTSLHPGERAGVQIYFGQMYDEHLGHESCSTRRAEKLAVFTMYESSAIPKDWVHKLNYSADGKGCDLVIVPSEWCRESFISSGVTKPIAVVPLGVNPRNWPYLRRQRTVGKPFTYLWVGFADQKDRKGGKLVSDAFNDLIDCGELPRDDVRLIMKSVPYMMAGINRNAEFDFDIGTRREIIKTLSQAQMLELYREADVAFNPTSGEGFGLIPLEQMATGLVIFAPYATGMLDYLNADLYYRLDTKQMQSVISDIEGDNSETIARPYFDDVRAKMLWAYENREKIRCEHPQISNYVHDHWTYAHSINTLANVLQEHFGYSLAKSWDVTFDEAESKVREVVV